MADLLNRQLGNYRLTRLIGHGGFADVYLGEHVHLGTKAALKVLRTRLDTKDREQFLQEGRTVARLSHPHIVRVLDFGIEETIPFLIMDYATHGSLRDLHPKGSRLQLRSMLPFIKQVAAALQYAHERHIIHRDVKPENMLLNADNEVMISDFGIATIVESTHGAQASEMVGTAAYMAPEQIRGQPVLASDQYALGIVIYEWLSGREPFLGTFTEVCSQHLLVTPPSLREKIPALAPAIEAVIQKALEKEPARRFTNVQAMMEALTTASQQEMIPAVDEDATIRRRVPATVSLPVVQATEKARDTDETMSREELNGQIRSAEDAPQKTQQAESPLSPTQHAEANHNTIFRIPFLERIPIKKSRRSLIIGAGSAVAGVTGVGGLIWFLTNRPQRNITPEQFVKPVTPVPSTENTPQIGDTIFSYGQHNGIVHALTLSPNGQYIVSGSADATARVWNIQDGDTLYTYQGHAGLLNSVLGISWAANGRLIASGGEDQTVQIWEAATGNRIASYQEHTSRVLAVAWSPDAHLLASGSADQTIRLWGENERESHAIYSRHTGALYALAWSPDSKRIVSGGADRIIQVWDVTTLQGMIRYQGHTGTIYALAWSPDGQKIASGSADGSVQIWEAETGNQYGVYRAGSALTTTISALAWSPDGAYVAAASTDQHVQVWNVGTNEHTMTYSGHNGTVYTLAWLPDGQYIVSGGADHAVKIWRAR